MFAELERCARCHQRYPAPLGHRCPHASFARRREDDFEQGFRTWLETGEVPAVSPLIRPRAVPSRSSERRLGRLIIDTEAREVYVDGTEVELTRLEFDLLDTLTARPRVVFTRPKLLELVWGPDWFGDDHVVDVHISSLRRKIGDDPQAPRFIRTVRGVGYRIGDGP